MFYKTIFDIKIYTYRQLSHIFTFSEIGSIQGVTINASSMRVSGQSLRIRIHVKIRLRIRIWPLIKLLLIRTRVEPDTQMYVLDPHIPQLRIDARCIVTFIIHMLKFHRYLLSETYLYNCVREAAKKYFFSGLANNLKNMSVLK